MTMWPNQALEPTAVRRCVLDGFDFCLFIGFSLLRFTLPWLSLGR